MWAVGAALPLPGETQGGGGCARAGEQVPGGGRRRAGLGAGGKRALPKAARLLRLLSCLPDLRTHQPPTVALHHVILISLLLLGVDVVILHRKRRSRPLQPIGPAPTPEARTKHSPLQRLPELWKSQA